MFTRIIAAAFAASLFAGGAAGTSAHADDAPRWQPVYRSGPWLVIMAKADDDLPLGCLLGREGAPFTIGLFATGREGKQVRLIASDAAAAESPIPADAGNVAVGIDGADQGGLVYANQGRAPYIEIERGNDFWLAFALGNRMTMRLGARTTTIPLAGSGKAFRAYSDCLTGVARYWQEQDDKVQREAREAVAIGNAAIARDQAEIDAADRMADDLRWAQLQLLLTRPVHCEAGRNFLGRVTVDCQ